MNNSNTFNPPNYLKNAHIQSVMNSIGPRKIRAIVIQKKLSTRQLILKSRNDASLIADFDSAQLNNETIVVLLHGWEGSSRSAYQVTTAFKLIENGFDVLRINFRDHGGSHGLNRHFFDSTMTGEVAEAIEDFLQGRNYQNVFLAGFSLGGSFALRIAADYGENLNLCATVAISPPVDPVNTMAHLNKALFIYERYFFKRWKRSLEAKQSAFPEYKFHEELRIARSLNDLNEFFIPRYTPYPSPTDYFSAYAITGNRLKSLTSQAYLIAALDDPVIPSADIDRIDPHSLLTIKLQRHGGHCGFIEDCRANSWIETKMVEIFDHHRYCKLNK
ncbi:MAG: alpha/beta fold hydrolase [Cellvibrionales bacterium TMED148]|nr:alpha/beta hydrolase [Porticoccaceae bacterium]RPG88984.1 MAG: alpha/beta fold hydrolase [Cellvibrionales bacterium TMED148]